MREDRPVRGLGSSLALGQEDCTAASNIVNHKLKPVLFQTVKRYLRFWLIHESIVIQVEVLFNMNPEGESPIISTGMVMYIRL